MRPYALIFALLLAATASAQVLELSGGQSTLMQGAGAGITAYLPNSVLKLGVGTTNGHLGFGVSDSFLFHGYSMTAGDSGFGYSVDSIGGASLQVRGVAIQRQNTDQSFAAFVGSTGVAYSLPFYTAGSNQHVGAGVYWRKKFGRLQLASLAALNGGQRTLLQSCTYNSSMFHFSGGGGYLAGQKTATALAQFQPIKEFQLVAIHQDLFWKNQSASVNSASTFLMLGRFTASATAINGESAGRRLSGQSAGVAAQFGWLRIQSNIYQASQRTWSQNVTQTFRHWHFQESLSGTHAFSGGLGYVGNRFSAGIEHSVAFVPFGGRGFQQITNLTLTFHVPHTDATANLAASMLPGAGIRYTAAGDSFVHGPLNIQSSQHVEHSHSSAGGKYIIQGRVVDESGKPVFGVAIELAGRLIFSDSTGAFVSRFRKAAPVSLAIVPAQFSQPGNWQVISAPATATPGAAPIQIVVLRK